MKAVIFDMDGVIIDSNPYHKESLQQFCKKYGYDLNEEQLRARIYGRTNKEWIPNLFGEISQTDLEKYAAEKEALFREIFAPHIEALSGLEDFLKKLETAQIPKAIGTSAPRANVDFTLEKTGLGSYFADSVILDESHVHHGKPDPEIYLKVAQEMGFPPQQCIVFEDSLSGVKAGKAANCQVVGVTTTHTPDELAEADLFIEDFTQLEIADLEKLFS